jgi:hypothetical protein
MKCLLSFVGLLLLSSAVSQTEKPPGEVLLVKIHSRYFKAPCKCYTFSQRNTHYRNDSVKGNSEWHEKVDFPDRFTIYFGDTVRKNYVAFRSDSSVRYKAGAFVSSKPDSNTLLLLLGGMFYRDIDDVIQRLKDARFDLTKTYVTKWMSDRVNVIGAVAGDTSSNQIWVDDKQLRVVRIIERMPGGETMDLRFENFQKWCKGYVETKVSFRRNGKLEQAEEYYNIKECAR